MLKGTSYLRDESLEISRQAYNKASEETYPSPVQHKTKARVAQRYPCNLLTRWGREFDPGKTGFFSLKKNKN